MESMRDPIAEMLLGGPCPPRTGTRRHPTNTPEGAEEVLIAFFRPMGLAPVRARSGELIGFAPRLEMPPEPEKASPAPITPTGIDLTDVWLRLGGIGELVAEVRGSVLAAEQRQLEALRAMEQRLSEQLARIEAQVTPKVDSLREKPPTEADRPPLGGLTQADLDRAYFRETPAVPMPGPPRPSQAAIPMPKSLQFPVGNGPDRT